MKSYRYFISCAKYLEELLLQELKNLGAQHCKASTGGVFCRGDLALAYQICLWSRVAHRVLLLIDVFDVETAEDLYQGVNAIEWDQHFSLSQTFVVHFTGESPQLRNTHYSALKIKDAIVDYFYFKTQSRPNVDKDHPDIRIQGHFEKNKVSIYLDVSGESLHKRGYRLRAGEAPIKETLAAALLMRAGWPQINTTFLDPFCGSGTILIEAAMMAADLAPGLLREQFGFELWQGHDEILWKKIQDEAAARCEIGLQKPIPKIIGFDIDKRIIEIARKNVADIGLAELIHLQTGNFFELPPPDQTGIIVTNPPLGERMQVDDDFTQSFGKSIQNDYPNWQIGLLIPDLAWLKPLNFNAKFRYPFLNGSIPCHFVIQAMLGNLQRPV